MRACTVHVLQIKLRMWLKAPTNRVILGCCRQKINDCEKSEEIPGHQSKIVVLDSTVGAFSALAAKNSVQEISDCQKLSAYDCCYKPKVRIRH